MSYIDNPRTILVSLDRKTKVTVGMRNSKPVWSVSNNCTGRSWQFMYRGEELPRAIQSFNRLAPLPPRAKRVQR